ncbi:MAG TPA: DegT/DnrJ/EryC1/StrS family aminotransferase [Nitrososphaerales archaeon]|nr:DegT/DnrJ/EryC1/StrS family aminotransferase [Nitrososphaerales archaeon]
MSFIPINKPILGEEEQKAVLEVLSTGRLVDASMEGGKRVREFEGKVTNLVGAKHAVAVNSGTAALHTTLMALGIKPGDEVVVPSLTFVATANVVLACGAKPVFVDVKRDYCIDPESFRKAVTRRTKAVIPVHVYGYPADMDEVREVASPRGIAVVEDAAESLGATYKGTQTGKLSDAGCFSLYATKVVTSGEGGAVTTDDDGLAERLRLVRNHGMIHGYDTRVLGFNYRLPEIGAAIASVQMDRLEGFLRARAKNARFLNDRVSTAPGVEFTQNADDRTHVYYLYTLHLKKKRDEIVKALNAAGVGAAVYWKIPVHKAPLYAKLGYGKKTLKRTEDAARHVISLPVHPGISEPDMQRVANEFLKAVRALA